MLLSKLLGPKIHFRIGNSTSLSLEPDKVFVATYFVNCLEYYFIDWDLFYSLDTTRKKLYVKTIREKIIYPFVEDLDKNFNTYFSISEENKYEQIFVFFTQERDFIANEEKAKLFVEENIPELLEEPPRKYYGR